MKGGGGKRKGSKFERQICRALSQWVTRGKREDVYWRTAMSGGRATIKGKLVRQAGDICSVAPEGHVLTDHWFIECKHVASLDVGQFIYNGVGKLAKFWKKAQAQAAVHGLDPMLIARQNSWTDFIVVTKVNHVGHWVAPVATIHVKGRAADISLFSSLIKAKFDK